MFEEAFTISTHRGDIRFLTFFFFDNSSLQMNDSKRQRARKICTFLDFYLTQRVYAVVSQKVNSRTNSSTYPFLLLI